METRYNIVFVLSLFAIISKYSQLPLLVRLPIRAWKRNPHTLCVTQYTYANRVQTGRGIEKHLLLTRDSVDVQHHSIASDVPGWNRILIMTIQSPTYLTVQHLVEVNYREFRKYKGNFNKDVLIKQ